MRKIAIALFLMACSLPEESVITTGTAPIMPLAGMTHPYTGTRVEEIRQAVVTDAAIRVTKHLNYNPNWDGVLAGAISGTVGVPRVDPANQLNCPQMWVSVWRQDNPGITYTWFFLPASAQAIGHADILPNGIAALYTRGCDYEFRNGGSGGGFPYIPVGSGNLYVAVWSACPGHIERGIGGVSAFDPILVYVPAGAAMTVRMPDLNGPYGSKPTWAAVAQQCGLNGGGDSRWTSPTTLHIAWCESTSGGCLPNSEHVREVTW